MKARHTIFYPHPHTMDSIKNALTGKKGTTQKTSGGGGLQGGLNEAFGGGRKGEQNEGHYMRHYS